MAARLLEERAPLDALASVLRYAFRDKLDRTRYRDIKTLRDEAVDGMGKTRLSIQLGGKDGATKRFLVDLVEKETGVPSSRIRDVEVFGRYSMITVPFMEAEKILKIFARKSRGERPLVEKASTGRKDRRFDAGESDRKGRYEKKGGQDRKKRSHNRDR